MGRFEKHRNIRKIMIKFYAKLMDSNIGKKLRGFAKWRHQLPERSDDPRIINTNKFERRMQNIFLKNFKRAFEPLKEQLFEGENAKRQIIRSLISKTMSVEKRMF